MSNSKLASNYYWKMLDAGLEPLPALKLIFLNLDLDGHLRDVLQLFIQKRLELEPDARVRKVADAIEDVFLSSAFDGLNEASFPLREAVFTRANLLKAYEARVISPIAPLTDDFLDQLQPALAEAIAALASAQDELEYKNGVDHEVEFEVAYAITGNLKEATALLIARNGFRYFYLFNWLTLHGYDFASPANPSYTFYGDVRNLVNRSLRKGSPRAGWLSESVQQLWEEDLLREPTVDELKGPLMSFIHLVEEIERVSK